jgi:hypothetical protein
VLTFTPSTQNAVSTSGAGNATSKDAHALASDKGHILFPKSEKKKSPLKSLKWFVVFVGKSYQELQELV